ncbi:MAG TPA: ornithine carbamoyltransferase [Phototrophicaceae bacterium]|nr:ornithine carbamoyltransferase [Phototrophicaceae bacterium]
MQHFIDLAEWSTEDLRQILDLAVHLKMEWRSGGNKPVLKGKALAMVFQKPSLRTRVSFEVGMQQLGGSALMIGPQEIGLGKRESIPDVARSLSCFVQGIMARVFAHADVLELAANATVPVINGLSDAQHPCQAMADVLTIYEHFGKLAGVRIVYVGDGNNVALSLGQAAANFGAHFAVASPSRYSLSEDNLTQVAEIAERNGGTIEAFEDPYRAVKDADVVYTDTWVSMGQEAETEERVEVLRPYQVNDELVKSAGKNAIVMHCLPAHRGYEITDSVADGKQSAIFQQAENRLHIQKAILVSLMS